MAIVEQGRTSRFILEYDEGVAPAKPLAQAMVGNIEGDFFLLRRYLPQGNGPSPDMFEQHPTKVIFIDATSKVALGLDDKDAANIPRPGGARNFGAGGGGVIWINAFGATGNPLSQEFSRFLFIAEMSEQLMGKYGWVADRSRGEALSRGLAEQFFPNSAYALESISVAPWVNDWLQSSPRFDYIGSNPGPTASNKGFGSDLDEPGYGCGVLFINYLRYQLNYTLDAICQAPATTLADTYRTLTGRTDDPFVVLQALIEAHYSSTYINLLTNNPFPLLESSARIVELGVDSTERDVPAFFPNARHPPTVHVSPFVTCPAKDYGYTRVLRAVTKTITATVTGFAIPSFEWSVNGRRLSSAGGERDEEVTFGLPDPAHPHSPKPTSGTVRFTWATSFQKTRDGFANVLVVTNETYDGVYDVEFSVDVAETFGNDAHTVAAVTVEFEAMRIVYVPQFYADLKVCVRRFEGAVPSLRRTVDLVLGRPDPASGRELAAAIRTVDAVRAEIGRIKQSDPGLAAHATAYAAERLEVDPKLLAETETPVHYTEAT